MERSFGFDVVACPRCADRMTLVALIRDAALVGRILRHLGLPDVVPAPRLRPPLLGGRRRARVVGHRLTGNSSQVFGGLRVPMTEVRRLARASAASSTAAVLSGRRCPRVHCARTLSQPNPPKVVRPSVR